MASSRSWWQPPALHQPGEAARRVTFLELFYDLVFVVVIARLAHHLAAHPDLGGLRDFVLLFVPTWWVWVSGTYYNERFETYDLSFRFFIFLQILAVAGMAATVEQAANGAVVGFTLAYVFARLIIVVMWARAAHHNPQVKPVTNIYLLGFGISIALWLISLALPPLPGLLLRGLGLLIEIATPMLTFRAQARVFRASANKLPERLGLFVIIVLGEALVGVINGFGDVEGYDWPTLLRFLSGLMVGFLLWWNYFDFVGRREPMSGPGKTWVLARWIYLHLPLLLGLTAIGAMLEHTIGVAEVGGEEIRGASEAAVGWLLAGAFSLVYVCLAALDSTLEREEIRLLSVSQTVLMRLGTAAAALALPLLHFSPVGVALGLVALQSLNAFVGARAWFASAHAGRTDVH